MYSSKLRSEEFVYEQFVFAHIVCNRPFHLYIDIRTSASRKEKKNYIIVKVRKFSIPNTTLIDLYKTNIHSIRTILYKKKRNHIIVKLGNLVFQIPLAWQVVHPILKKSQAAVNIIDIVPGFLAVHLHK